MKDFLKNNWFKLGILIILLFVGISVAYYYAIFLPQKERLVQGKNNSVIDKNRSGLQKKDPEETENDKEEWERVERILDSEISNEFYNKIAFPLEFSDTPVMAVYYNGNISQESMDEFAAEISNWPMLRTDFISPTCVRQIYNSPGNYNLAGNLVTGKRNEYWLYFVDKKLRLASF